VKHGLAATLVVALGASCMSLEDDDWRFCLSRCSYDEVFERMDANEPLFDADEVSGLESGDRSPYAFLLLPMVMAVPLALDIVALPVTVSHDLLDD
jgi:hypothetical protein